AFLARLDEPDASRTRDTLRIQRLDRGDGREDRIAVVGATPSIEATLFVNRRPRTEALPPSGHLGLLVQVAIERNRLRRCPVAARRHLEEEEWRAPGQPNDLDREAGKALRLHPALGLANGGLDVAVLLPFAVEMRRLGGNADVFGELGND